MDIRKTLNDIKSSISGRTMSDLERRKLEAELKAAEEMAKLKEVIIEKRLAYELATLEDGVNFEPSASVLSQSTSENTEALLTKNVRKEPISEIAETSVLSRQSESKARLYNLPQRKPSNTAKISILNIQKPLEIEYPTPVSTVFANVNTSSSRKFSQGNVRAPYTDTRNPGTFVSSDMQYVAPPCDDDKRTLKNYNSPSRIEDEDEDSDEDEDDEDYEEGRMSELNARHGKLAARWKSIVSRVRSKLRILKPHK